MSSKNLLENDNEAYNELFWQDGICGNLNIVTYNGEDVRGVAYVQDDTTRRNLVLKHNTIVRQLLNKA